jgi:uncharacterized protein (TIGR03437 family)
MQTGTFGSTQYLSLPPGFRISVWSRLTNPRFVTIAGNGDVFVSQPDLGQITILRPDPNGGDPAQFVYVSGLNEPQGVAFDTVNGVTWLYVGETGQIERYVYRTGDTAASGSPQVLVSGLLARVGHLYKDIAIGPDHSVYFGMGSSCNVCAADVVATPELAAVYRMNPDGSGLQVFASGLRNPEGLAFIPGTNSLWAAVNNRDEILYPYKDSTGQYGQLVRSYVDDHPPDLFTALRQGGNYGWPFCNSTEDSPVGFNGMPFDNDQDTNSDAHIDCGAMDRVSRGLQAHSAPLGVAFTQGTRFAGPYRNGAIIGFHGSWDRTVPTGYKLVYLPFSTVSGMPNDQVDLTTGFLEIGARPVDVAIDSSGALLITDDATWTIYKLIWAPSAVSAANGFAVLAPNSYASVYGSGLASQNASAGAPYPTSLGGISLSLQDSTGLSFTAPLVYVSSGQINFIVPAGVAPGTTHLTLNSGSNSQDLGYVQIVPTAPGLFTISGDGTGIAAATAIDSKGNAVPVFRCAGGNCTGTPVTVTGNTVFLSLYGTGIRGAASGTVQVRANGIALPVTYAGAQGTYPGLDQINVTLQPWMAGGGDFELDVMIGGATSNVVTVQVN